MRAIAHTRAMAIRTVHLETELPTSAERVWSAMRHPASFLYVTRGVVGFPALAGRTDPIRSGEIGTGWVLAFNVIPAYRHTIEVLDVDEATRTIRSHEFGGALRRWDHTLHVERIDERSCRYSDTIEIDAGVLTGAAAAIATGIFRYRQRRWHRLVRNQLALGGPRYALAAPMTSTS